MRSPMEVEYTGRGKESFGTLHYKSMGYKRMHKSHSYSPKSKS
jgi:hypothetical protein